MKTEEQIRERMKELRAMGMQEFGVPTRLHELELILEDG